MAEKFYFLLAGATATGKSSVAQLLAERTGLPILSADSMLVYQGMDIGTAKPTPQERGEVPYFGIDLATPAQNFSAGLWAEAARSAIAQSDAPGFIVAGGTGLYFRALVSGFDFAPANPARREYWQGVFEREGIEELQNRLRALSPQAFDRLGGDVLNPRRVIRALEIAEAPKDEAQEVFAPAAGSKVYVLRRDRAKLHRRIAQRVQIMFDTGLLEETSALKERYPVWSETASGAIGYAEALAVLEGRLGRERAQELIAVRTNQLAKRQETWFRHQTDSVFLDISEDDTIEEIVERILKLEEFRQF